MSQVRGKPLDYGILPDLLAYRLRRAKARFSQHFLKTVGQDGITLGQFDVLTLIARNPGLTQTVLARAIGIERSTCMIRSRPLLRVCFSKAMLFGIRGSVLSDRWYFDYPLMCCSGTSRHDRRPHGPPGCRTHPPERTQLQDLILQ